MNRFTLILSLLMLPMIHPVLAPAATVSGRVITQGIPAGVTYPLALVDAETGKRFLATPNRLDGSFEFTRIPPGRYAMRSPVLSGGPITLTVENQSLENIVVPLSMKEFTGHLKVEGASGGAPRRIAFIVGDDDSGFLTSSTDCDPGRTFRIALPEGKFRFSLAAAGHKVKAFSLGPQNLLLDKATVIESTSSTTFEVTLAPDGKSSEPKVIYQVLPEAGAQTSVRGEVQLSIVVNADGSIDFKKVLKTSDPALDRIAIDAVKKWGFLPGTKNGIPVATTVSVTLNF